MEQNENLLAQELTITKGTIFHFKNESHSDQSVIVEESNDRYSIMNMDHICLSVLFEHPEINALWDQLNISWLYKDIAHPKLYLNKDFLKYILSEQISDAVTFSHYLLKEYNLHTYIDAQEFLFKVMQNSRIGTLPRLIICCQIIKVIFDKTLLNKLKIYINETIENPERAAIIECYANANIKIDVNKSSEVLEQEWFKQEVEYIGELNLPGSFKVLTKIDQFSHYHLKTGRNKAFFKSVMFKHLFVIQVTNKQIYFTIEPLHGTIWFQFHIDYKQKGYNYDSEISALGYALAQPENQKFFQSNYMKTAPINIKANSSIHELLDNVL